MTPFLVSSYFATHPITLLLEILGGRMHWPSPHLKFWRDRPHKSPPMPTIKYHLIMSLGGWLLECFINGSPEQKFYSGLMKFGQMSQPSCLAKSNGDNQHAKH